MVQLLPWLATISSLLPSAIAFYPYHQPTSDDIDFESSSYRPLRRSQVPRDDRLTFSLQKLPGKRDNAFTVISASSPSQSNSLGVDQDGTDFSYFCAFQFGSSSKTFYLLLDSAAANTWVMASGCTTSACKVHDTLGPGDSSSLKTTTTPFSVAYGTGSVSGVTASDTLKTSAFSVPFTFGLAANVSDDFASYPMDGIIGFGRADEVASTATNVKGPTLMDVLVSQKVITQKQFGISLWRTADGGSNTGEINFGAPDSSRYAGSLNYIPTVTNANGFWEIPIDNAGVNGTLAGLTGRTAIVDSGTSFILMPQPDAAKLHALIPGSAQSGESFTVPCSTTLDVQIAFGGVAYTVSHLDYVGKSSGGSGQCMSNIIGRQTFGASQWLMGDVFLKNVYAVFDFDNARVGFGVRAAGASSVAVNAVSVSQATGSAAANATGLGFLPATTAGHTTSSTGVSAVAESQTRGAGSSSTPTRVSGASSTVRDGGVGRGILVGGLWMTLMAALGAGILI